jgi:hypothetical protein
MKLSPLKTWLGICFLLSALFHTMLKSGGMRDASTGGIVTGTIVTLLLAGVWYFFRFITRFDFVRTLLGRSVMAVATAVLSGIVLCGMGMEAGPGIGGVLGLIAMGRASSPGSVA